MSPVAESIPTRMHALKIGKAIVAQSHTSTGQTTTIGIKTRRINDAIPVHCGTEDPVSCSLNSHRRRVAASSRESGEDSTGVSSTK
jgi:hypothetical protein